MLFHADVVYLGQSAKLRFPFVSLGLVTEAAAAYLGPVTIGHKQAAELLFTAEFFGAEKALQYGMATQVFEDDELMAKALHKARQMAQWPIDSLVAVKRIMKAMHGEKVALARKLEMKGFAELMGSKANMEAFTAFMERRRPISNSFGSSRSFARVKGDQEQDGDQAQEHSAPQGELPVEARKEPAKPLERAEAEDSGGDHRPIFTLREPSHRGEEQRPDEQDV